ncbi:MAG: PIN domain-containing protein [Candidatus Bathyarchaeia archaeon]
MIGLDTNILCYALDPAYPEHEKLQTFLLDLSPENRAALNPTIIHETYHTLVFGQKWVPSEAVKRLKMLLKHPYIEFFSQTKKICIIALSLANQHKLGGRDSLMIANFLANKVPTIYTHDQELLTLREISWRNNHLTFKDPIIKR